MTVISHNIEAMNAQRQFGINRNNRAKTSEKLSSGYRINRAADDAAGLSISEKMRKQIRGLTQGVENTQTGVSLCQVADGALEEVTSMMQRISELSVQAANGTNSKEDRNAIQEEVCEILSEINRIGETTTFNEQPIFKGSDQVIKNADGTAAKFGELSFDDFELVNVDLGKTPLVDGEGGDIMHLQAIVNKQDSVLNGKTFNLIYGSGNTSNSSFRITDTSGNQNIIKMDGLAVTDFQTAADGKGWSRTFKYAEGTSSEVVITQKVILDSAKQTATEKNYTISYEFSKGSDIQNIEFMFHADTAYNNNDRCEGYFINGSRVEEYCVYNKDPNGSDLVTGVNNTNIYNGNMTNSLSIIDVDEALAFSEKITFHTGQEPDSLSIGYYNQIDEWSYYDVDSLDRNLGMDTNKQDLGFSLYYNLGNLQQGSAISFDYGIVSKENDSNLYNVTIETDTRDAMEHLEDMSVWIQSGADAGDGMYIVIGEMNTTVLGMENLDISTISGANNALNILDDALQKLSGKRSRIGAQQNRLEHTIANEDNIIENTTAAESRIRDVDMAEEMVRFSKEDILTQIGQSIMAQANQSKNGILNLLQ